MRNQTDPDLRWTNEPPPFGTWAYSQTEGLFCIEEKTATNYLMIHRVCQFTRRKLETGTRFTVFLEGPFIYPIPDPTKGIK